MVYNQGFTGLESLNYCAFQYHPDHYYVQFPGVGIFNPGAYMCVPDAGGPGYPVVVGLDGGQEQVWTCESEGIYTDFQRYPSGQPQVATHQFALVRPEGNGVAIFNGISDRGVFCGMSGEGGQNNEQGYGLILKHENQGAYLVQYIGGLTQYRVLTYRPNAWALGGYTRVTLECWSDATQLKGVYLRAIVGPLVIAECVYAGSYADVNVYIPPGDSWAGPGVVAYNTIVSYHMG